MNILHISNTDSVGGRFTGYYMRQALDTTHTVKMAVWNRTMDNPDVHSMRSESLFFRLLTSLAKKCDDMVGLDGLTGLGGWALPFQDYFKRADIVHLHLIRNDAYFSTLSLPTLSRLKPLVWTLHDPWALTGGCLHSFDCDRWLTGCNSPCPYPYPRHKSLFRHHIPTLHWKIKKWVYQRSNLNLVVASKWMQDRVQRSPLLRHFPCHLIPFGVDLENFKPHSKIEARKKLGIWPNQKVIAFRDVGFKRDLFKGLRWLMEALQLYEPREPTCLLILQDGCTFQSLWPKYNVITPGWIDGEQLAIALSAADIFLMPSIQEAFGLMAVESMACGTPVIVFEGTALPDVVQAPKGGLVVPAKDSVALAKAIDDLLHNSSLHLDLVRGGLQLVRQEYDFNLYVKRHLDLYDSLLSFDSMRV